MDIFKPMADLKEAVDGSDHDYGIRTLWSIVLEDGRTASFRLLLQIDDAPSEKEGSEY